MSAKSEAIVNMDDKQRGHWIYNNSEAVASLMRGIKDAQERRLHDLGSFEKYAKDDE